MNRSYDLINCGDIYGVGELYFYVVCSFMSIAVLFAMILCCFENGKGS